MKILFLTNLLPYPLDNGGKIKTFTTIKALADGGHDIDLLCFKETSSSMNDEETKLLEMCNSVNQIFLPLTTANHKRYMVRIATKSLFSALPFSIYKYQSNAMKKKLKEQRNKQYDLVYFDHLPMCVYLKYVHKLWPNAKIILDEHNCEAVIARRKAKESCSIIKKIFLIIETLKLEKFEVDSIGNTDKIIVLSNADYKSLVTLINHEFNHSIIPISVPDRGMKNNLNNEILNILFIGTLTWEPNNAGLLWFLCEVMPIVEAKKLNIHLFIVGKNPSKEVKEISTEYKDKITITGYVDSIDEYYDKCDCTIVPLFIGSGQRVKLIEAFSKGMPAISTTIGAEGLEYDGESIIIADEKNKFADAIELMQDRKIREKLRINSRKVYDKFYAPDTISKLIRLAVEEGDENNEE